MITITVTGAAGQIGYCFLPLLASGAIFGPDTPIKLRLLEVPDAMDSLRGSVMELEDCAFPLIDDLWIGEDPKSAFTDADFVICIAGKPRGPGQERSDVILENAKIYQEHGKALDQAAKKDVQVLVVANPANTNALIMQSNAPSIPSQNFYSLMHLDVFRAKAQVAKKLGVRVNEIENVLVWGNHSSTMVPDIRHARVGGVPLDEKVDPDWIRNEFLQTVQQRGASIIRARGKSSAISAANATAKCLKDIATPSETVFCAGRRALDNPYGFDPNIVISMPLCHHFDGTIAIEESIHLDDHTRHEISRSIQELQEEREIVAAYL